jgi:hypothetical protein
MKPVKITLLSTDMLDKRCKSENLNEKNVFEL